MKQRAKSLLALASMAIMSIFAMLALPSLASAAEILPAVSNGGVTCHHYTSATTWPTTYWNCDDSAYGGTTTANQAKVITTAANALQTPVKSVLQGQTIDVYVFKNAADFGAFFGVTAPPANAMSAAKGTSVAAAFSYATQNGSLQDLRAKLTPGIHQGLGRLYDNIQGNPSTNDPAFAAAIQYDKDEMNRYLSSTVWSTIYMSYPGQSPSQILSSAYGSTNQDWFAFKFQQNANGTSDTVTPLRNVMSSITYTQTTNGVMKKNTYQESGLPSLDVRGGVICAHWSTGWADPDWPSDYYHCAHPFSPQPSVETQIKASAHGLSTAERALYRAHGVKIYAMRSAADYQNYFGETLPNGTAGVLGAGNAAHGVFPDHAAAFRYSSTGADIGSLMGGTIIHELGHHMDRIYGTGGADLSANASSVFRQKLALDIAAFNSYTGSYQTACFNKIDQYLEVADRVCANFTSATPLWDVVTSLHIYGTVPREVFAQGYAYGYGPTVDFITDIQAQMTNVNTYMVTVHSTAVAN